MGKPHKKTLDGNGMRETRQEEKCLRARNVNIVRNEREEKRDKYFVQKRDTISAIEAIHRNSISHTGSSMFIAVSIDGTGDTFAVLVLLNYHGQESI